MTEAAGLRPALKVVLLLRPLRNPLLLNGAGVVIVNPPYQLAAELGALMPFLAKTLGEDGKGLFRLAELTTEVDAVPRRTELDGRKAQH